MTEVVTLKNVEDVSLDHHGFIEASAGTGKTYLLEHLTLRILEEKEVDLPEILLVTFTEKATGELKGRIRERLWEKIENSPEALHREKHQKALLQFDEASISTIHGFCQKSLKQFALEAGQDFRQEVTSDPLLYSSLLEKLMRDAWPDYFGEHLAELLIISGFPNPYNDSMSKIILELAQKFHPGSGDRLYPHFPDDYGPQDLLEEVHHQLNRLLNLLGEVSLDRPEAMDFVKKYEQINFNGKTKSANINNVLIPLVKFLANHQKSPVTLTEFHEFFCNLKLSAIGKLFPDKEKWTKGGKDYRNCLPQLPDFVEQLKNVRRQYVITKNYLVVRSVTLLQEKARQHKEEKGLLSYDDMLQRLRDALLQSPTLVRQMQEKYQYALVDEFQDTDRVQWEIFSTLFTGNTRHRLYLIGDPKQAIYGFRGADIHTYLEAREVMQENPECRFYTQNINWRSIPQLIEGFNCLFCGEEWFPPGAEIQAESVSAPPDKKNDESQNHPIKVFKISEGLNGTQARRETARRIASEIKNLLKNKPVEPDDIFILIRKGFEAEPVEKELQKLDIPYEYYKKSGLFQSREAFHVNTLFKALSYMEDPPSIRAALLSDFFRYPPFRLAEGEEQDPLYIIYYEKLIQWRLLAETRQWAKFFQEIQSDGNLYLTAHEEDRFPEPVSSRTRVNYRSILQILEHRAVSEDWSLEQLVENMQKFISTSSLEEEELSLYFPDSSGPRVKIMTIHMSKGLQAKVVFLAGGYTGNTGNKKDPDYCQYFKDQHRVFDLTLNAEALQAHHEKEDNENRRLYYVALTRSRERLYLPFFQMEEDKVKDSGPPLQTFIQKTLDSILKNPTGSRAFDLHPGAESHISLDAEVTEKTDSTETVDPVIPEAPQNLFLQNISIESFTKLWRACHKYPEQEGGEETELDELLQFDEGILEEKQESSFESDNLLLPPGARTGSMLHEVMERIDLQLFLECPNYSYLEREYPEAAGILHSILKKYGFDPEESLLPEEVYKLICPAANLPIPHETKKILLGAIPSKNRRAEMEFFLPFPEEELWKIKKALPEDNRFYWSRENHLRGFIDLVFRLPMAGADEYRYFVLDWKSNYLEAGYEKENLHQAMLEHGYHLQAGIYGMALCQWLQSIDSSFSYEKHFGGIYYVFLRGLSRQKPEEGVYYFRPGKEEQLQAGKLMNYILRERGKLV